MWVGEQRAWRDWSRVEECVAFGVKRWGLTLFAALLVNKYVSPESAWLELLLIGLILWLHRVWVTREDARLSKLPD